MPSKPALLVVGDYNREDYLHTFKECKDDFNFYFIEFISRREVLNNTYKQFGEALYWGDYSDALDLLDRVKPSKVIFFYVESFFHVALLLACKVKGIRTYHLEHGIRDININLRLSDKLPVHIGPGKARYLTNVILQFRARIKGRLFLNETQKTLPEAEATLFKQFYKLRKKHSYPETIAKLNTPILWPDESITYSRKVFDVHKHSIKLSDNYPIHYIGIPSFDHLANINQTVSPQKNILFLDQGLSNRGYFGWTKQAFIQLLKQLENSALQAGFKLYIKPHPTHPDFKQYGKYLKHSIIIDDSELTRLIPDSNVILGFFSTLMLPLAAMQHTTLITLENHPIGKLDVSKSWIDAGVAHPVYSLEDLAWALKNIELLHQRQLPNKKQFEQDWLYKFDGKAGERLRTILLSDEL
jgi:hypothetical protein